MGWEFFMTDGKEGTCNGVSVVADYFYPEDGGDTFLRNVGSYNSHMVSHLPP
jgi:hypothetical protein